MLLIDVTLLEVLCTLTFVVSFHEVHIMLMEPCGYLLGDFLHAYVCMQFKGGPLHAFVCFYITGGPPFGPDRNAGGSILSISSDLTEELGPSPELLTDIPTDNPQ